MSENKTSENTTTAGVSQGDERLMMLSTTEIIEPEFTNVRPWTVKMGDDEEEFKRIEALAQTIEEGGQVQPVRVIATGEGYKLIAGRRRKRAIELINAGRKAGSDELLIQAVVVPDTTTEMDAFRQAVVENWHRENISPMDMAADIERIRTEMKWTGKKGTKQVASLLKVSPATITQYEKLLSLPEELQAKVHTGELTRDDAFKLVVIADKQGADVAVAAVKEAERAAVQVQEADATEWVEAVEPDAIPAKAGKPKNAKKAVKAAAVAKSKVIKQKAREAAPDRPMPRSKSEILEFFEGLQGPVYGHANGAPRQFIENLLKYAAGELTDRTLEKYWAAMVEKAYKGTPEVKAAAEKKSETAKAAKPAAAKATVKPAAAKSKAKAKPKK